MKVTEIDRWTAAMLDGDFERAWRVTDEIEIPRRALGYRAQPCHLLWDGSPIEGRKVVIRCRHGLGDTIQFLRYVRPLREIAAAVYVDAQPELHGFIGPMPDLRAGECVEVECMELPYLFRTTLDTIPSDVPYLSAPSRPRFFDAGDRLSVGLVWGSGVFNPARSMRLSDLVPLTEVEGVAFYSLQQGPASDELRHAPFAICPLYLRTREIANAAAAMTQLDLIITVDTLAAHLAGALGRPVWTMLPYDADWRWMRDRDDSPWYPTMRLFRQPAPGAWADVAKRVAAELIEYATLHRPESAATGSARSRLL